MAVQTIPARIRWAVDFMDVQPNDHILEIGCGPGAAAELICSRLETGRLFAIDRSESGVDRTRRRCAKFVEAGRLTVRQIDLATLPGGSVYLYYDASRPEQVPTMVEKASAALQQAGFRISVVEQKAPAVVGIIGKR